MAIATDTLDTAAASQALAAISLPTLDGGQLRIADLRGRKVLLFCWASW